MRLNLVYVLMPMPIRPWPSIAWSNITHCIRISCAGNRAISASQPTMTFSTLAADTSNHMFDVIVSWQLEYVAKSIHNTGMWLPS